MLSARADRSAEPSTPNCRGIRVVRYGPVDRVSSGDRNRVAVRAGDANFGQVEIASSDVRGDIRVDNREDVPCPFAIQLNCFGLANGHFGLGGRRPVDPAFVGLIERIVEQTDRGSVGWLSDGDAP